MYFEKRKFSKEESESFYENRYSEEMRSVEDTIDLAFLYAEFQKINDVAGTVSFDEAKNLIMTERPEIEDPLFRYFFDIYKAEKVSRINWAALTLLVIECVRVCTQSAMFEKQISRMKEDSKEHFSAASVLGLIKDLAPKCPRKQLQSFVLHRISMPDESEESMGHAQYNVTKKVFENGTFSHEGTSTLQYGEIMCPKEIWRDITKRYNFFGQN
jgi:hypothetical protein